MYTIDCCLYRVVFFLYSDSEMLKAFEKTIEFFHDVYRETSQLQPPPPPPPNEHMTFLVEKIDM